jgi:hypothetical protein
MGILCEGGIEGLVWIDGGRDLRDAFLGWRESFRWVG